MGQQQVCPTCGAPRRTDSRFCVGCGAAFDAPQAPAIAPQGTLGGAGRMRRKKSGVAGRVEGPNSRFVRQSISLELEDDVYAALFRAASQTPAAGSQAQTGLRAT